VKDGVWHVVMRRPLVSEEQENEAKLIPGRVQTVSFAVWNGENKERNGQKAVAPGFSSSSTQLRSCSRMLKKSSSREGMEPDIFCARATRGLGRPSLDARSGRSISPHPWRENEQAWKDRFSRSMVLVRCAQ